MGTTASLSGLTEDILVEYSILTYLSKTEILSLYKTFWSLGAQKLEDLHYRYEIKDIEDAFPQLKYNPFKERIYQVFSSLDDGKLSFEDILDLCSVMSQKCPTKVKVAWAFRIFDYDNDGYVSEDDLKNAIDNLTNYEETNQRINAQDQKDIFQVLLKEMDLESSGTIGKEAFAQVVGNLSEFPHSFHFRF